MSDDDLITHPQLEQIAGRALRFQRYVFRRAWGVYYAVWAAAIAAFSFGYPVISLIPPPANLPWIPYALFYGGVGIIAGFASAWIFRNAAKTAHLRTALQPNRNVRWQYRLIGIWWLAFYVIIGISFTYFSAYAITIFFAMLFSVVGFVYYLLRFSFDKEIPVEGKLAVISYGAATAVSFVASIFTPATNYVPTSVAWFVAIVVWLFCALYSLKRAPEELVELSF